MQKTNIKETTEKVAKKITEKNEKQELSKKVPDMNMAPDMAPDMTPNSVSGSDEKQGKKRQQLIKILGINISKARCAAHITSFLSSGPIKLRVSGSTSVAVATLMDSIVNDLIIHALDRAIRETKGTINIWHFHDGPVENIRTYPIFNKVKVYSSVDAQVDDKSTQTKNETDTVTAKMKFVTYIHNAIKDIKKNDKFSHLRVPSVVREYLSNIVIGSILRIVNVAKYIAQGIIKAKTINAEHIKAATYILMMDEGKSEEDINSVIQNINDKLTIYKNTTCRDDALETNESINDVSVEEPSKEEPSKEEPSKEEPSKEEPSKESDLSKGTSKRQKTNKELKIPRENPELNVDITNVINAENLTKKRTRTKKIKSVKN